MEYINMSKFDKLYNNVLESISLNIKPFEDYSNTIEKVTHKTIPGKCYKYTNCDNNCIISEDSLSRTLDVMQNKDFAILTAYRAKFDKVENTKRNRILRGMLNDKKMGPHQLVGHWQEAPDGKDYKDCEKGELTDVI